MEVTATVAAESFQLTVDGLDSVGSRQRSADSVGVIQERQVVFALFAEFGNEGGVILFEAFAEFFKESGSDLGVPAGPQSTPALLELGGVRLGEMAFGVALHMNDAELNVRVGEKTFGDGEQPGEIILNDNQNATEATLDQVAQDGFPILEVFAAQLDRTGEDLFCRRCPTR